MKRRTFYEVTLHDWIVRHDLDGDGLIMKTVELAGTGYDRCQEFDDLILDVKISQKNSENEFVELFKKENLETKTGNQELVFQAVARVLNSMKRGEHSSSVIHPAFYVSHDSNIVKQLSLNTDKIIKVDIKLH